MALDSSGYNTSSLFQAKNYDPTNSALVNGLQSTATYDPTTQSTTTPTSAVGFLSGKLNSQNTDQGDTASTTQNLQSTNGYGTLTAALSSGTQQSVPTAGTMGLTKASNNALNSNYSATLPTNSKISVAPTTGAPLSTINTGNQAAAQNTYRNSLTQYQGAQIVGVRTKDGGIAYYQFDPSKGGYTFQQMTDGKGNVVLGGAQTAYAGNGQIVNVAPRLTDAQRASAQLQTVAGTQLTMGNVEQSGGLIGQQAANAVNIASWNKANQAAYDTAQAASATAAQSAAQQQALDYMTTHGGQLPPELQAIASNTYTGNSAVQQAQQAGIAAAQQAYAAQQAHASTLGGLQMGAINTSASDATDQAAMASLISQYASRGGVTDGGAGARMGGFAAASLAGQNQLNHEKAAAASYNSNLSNFANALNTQNSADATATGNQLFSDIQGVQQIASQLQQEIGQLGTKAQNQMQGQLDNLNNSLSQYQQAVHEFGQGSAQAMAIAKSILSAAASAAAQFAG